MADTRTLSQFKNKLAGGGARPNLFEVSIPSFPSAIGDRVWRTGSGREANQFKFLCKAAQLPASTITEIPAPFRGRILKVAGDRTFDVWTVTVINDEDFQLRTAFETWMNTMSKLNDATGVTNPASYMTDAYVTQLGRGRVANATRNTGGQSSELRTYKFYDIFPTEVSAIDLSYENTDTIEEFTVTFQVQYFTIGNSSEANRAAPGQTLIQ
jgi:hypothetical protein